MREYRWVRGQPYPFSVISPSCTMHRVSTSVRADCIQGEYVPLIPGPSAAMRIEFPVALPPSSQANGFNSSKWINNAGECFCESESGTPHRNKLLEAHFRRGIRKK